MAMLWKHDKRLVCSLFRENSFLENSCEWCTDVWGLSTVVLWAVGILFFLDWRVTRITLTPLHSDKLPTALHSSGLVDWLQCVCERVRDRERVTEEEMERWIERRRERERESVGVLVGPRRKEEWDEEKPPDWRECSESDVCFEWEADREKYVH